MNTEWKQGLKDGIPIAIGYFSVSFSFGIVALKDGLTLFQAVLTSLTNVTSAGQFAGLQIMVAGGTIIEIILTQIIINLRYALMSLSLSQKISKEVSMKERLVMAFANTDEIFAVAMAHDKELTLKYMLGLEILPILGWTAGTACGAVACDILPKSLGSALGIALYGMFVAIVVPVAKKSRPVFLVVIFTILFSCLMYYVPIFHCISNGIAIILATVAGAVLGAVLFPVPSGEDDDEMEEKKK